MMTLVTNVTHTSVPTMHRCLTASLTPTHLFIASLTPLGYSHAHYLLNMGRCNRMTLPMHNIITPFLLGTSARTNESITLKPITLTLLGPYKGALSERLHSILSHHYLEVRTTKLRLQVLIFCDLAAARCKSH